MKAHQHEQPELLSKISLFTGDLDNDGFFQQGVRYLEEGTVCTTEITVN